MLTEALPLQLPRNLRQRPILIDPNDHTSSYPPPASSPMTRWRLFAFIGFSALVLWPSIIFLTVRIFR